MGLSHTATLFMLLAVVVFFSEELQVNSLCLLQSFYFKLRSMIPCCLCHLNFTVAVPEEELIQVRSFRPSLICEIAGRTELIDEFEFFLYLLLYLCLSASQVAVTAVAMTFDKDQTQEKPPDKPITKGLPG